MSAVLAIALAALAQPPQNWDAPGLRGRLWSFAHVSVRRAFQDTTTQIDVATIEAGAGAEHRYWFRRRIVRNPGGAVVATAYADTSTCPAARAQLALLEALDMPRPDVIGTGREMGILITDGARYTLEGRALHSDTQVGGYRIDSNVDSPLARWTDSMLAILDPCWAPTPAL